MFRERKGQGNLSPLYPSKRVPRSANRKRTVVLNVQLTNVILKQFLDVGAESAPIFLRKLFKFGL
jgi:hypothetical protein